MRLVSFEFLVIGILNVHRPPPQLRDAAGEVIDHRGGRRFVAHLEERLILAFEHQDICDASEGDSQVDDFRLGHVVRNVADMDHAGRFSHVLFQFYLKQ